MNQCVWGKCERSGSESLAQNAERSDDQKVCHLKNCGSFPIFGTHSGWVLYPRTAFCIPP